jgi:hypothetical protein
LDDLYFSFKPLFFINKAYLNKDAFNIKKINNYLLILLKNKKFRLAYLKICKYFLLLDNHNLKKKLKNDFKYFKYYLKMFHFKEYIIIRKITKKNNEN